VLLQSDGLDEVKVGIQYLLRRMAAEHADEQRHDALHYQRVALCLEPHDAAFIVGLQPHPALAAVYQVALHLVLLVQRLLLVA